jgi:Xaa-Pro aminopeptidase
MPAEGAAGFDGERLSALMKRDGADALLASTRHNVRYLTGGYCYPLYAWDAHTRGTQYLPFLVIPADRLEEAFLVGRPGEGEALEESRLWPGRCQEASAIGTRPAAAKAVEALKGMGLDRGRIAVELPSLPADAFRVLAEGLPRVELVDAVPILDALRAVKSAREIQVIREAARRNLEAVTAVLTSGRDGESTAEVSNRVASEFGRRELHFLYALVCAGPGFFRIPSDRRRWKRDCLLHIDTGGMLDGYIAETCRMGFLGRPPALADRLLAACLELEEAVLPALRPGLPSGEVQRHGDEFLKAHPLGKYGRFIAHGIGLVHHEDPVVDRLRTEPLEAGMVLSLEMEFLHPDAGHVKIEDMVAVTETGGELLSPEGRDWLLSGP